MQKFVKYLKENAHTLIATMSNILGSCLGIYIVVDENFYQKVQENLSTNPLCVVLLVLVIMLLNQTGITIQKKKGKDIYQDKDKDKDKSEDKEDKSDKQ